ncbi:MAG: hypothetical protein MHPSP_003032 [Paramarteilia canceri]
MGVDTGRRKHHTARRVHTNSTNPYKQYLVKLTKILVNKSGSKCMEKIHHRLIQSRTNQAPVSLKKVSSTLKGRSEKDCAIVAATVTSAKPSDEPALKQGIKVAALRFTEKARHQIERRGGEALTIDEYLTQNPLCQHAVLLRGKQSARKATKYFGPPPGAKNSKTKQRVFNERKERAKNRMFRSK